MESLGNFHFRKHLENIFRVHTGSFLSRLENTDFANSKGCSCRDLCPHWNKKCHNCRIKGHISPVCAKSSSNSWILFNFKQDPYLKIQILLTTKECKRVKTSKYYWISKKTVSESLANFNFRKHSENTFLVQRGSFLSRLEIQILLTAKERKRAQKGAKDP